MVCVCVCVCVVFFGLLFFFYVFHFITKQLCRQYALLSNINSILFLYSCPTLIPPPPPNTHTCTLQKWENVLLREITSLEGDNLLVICYSWWIQLPHDHDYDDNMNYCARYKKSRVSLLRTSLIQNCIVIINRSLIRNLKNITMIWKQFIQISHFEVASYSIFVAKLFKSIIRFYRS